jgi:hypothetical protein
MVAGASSEAGPTCRTPRLSPEIRQKQAQREPPSSARSHTETGVLRWPRAPRRSSARRLRLVRTSQAGGPPGMGRATAARPGIAEAPSDRDLTAGADDTRERLPVSS